MTWKELIDREPVLVNVWEDDRLTCKKCGTACRRRTWGSYHGPEYQLQRKIEKAGKTEDVLPPVARTVRVSNGRYRAGESFVADVPANWTDKAKKIYCESCAEKLKDAAEKKRNDAARVAEDRRVEAAREKYPNTRAVRIAAERAVVRKAALGLGHLSCPADIRLLDERIVEGYPAVWEAAVQNAQEQIAKILQQEFPEAWEGE